MPGQNLPERRQRNESLTTGKAAERYGFGRGPRARYAFIKYVERLERKSGRQLFDRSQPRRWRIDTWKIPIYAPDLLKYVEESTMMDMMREELGRFNDVMEERVAKMVAAHPEVARLKNKVEALEETVELLSGGTTRDS